MPPKLVDAVRRHHDHYIFGKDNNLRELGIDPRGFVTAKPEKRGTSIKGYDPISHLCDLTNANLAYSREIDGTTERKLNDSDIVKALTELTDEEQLCLAFMAPMASYPSTFSKDAFRAMLFETPENEKERLLLKLTEFKLLNTALNVSRLYIHNNVSMKASLLLEE